MTQKQKRDSKDLVGAKRWAAYAAAGAASAVGTQAAEATIMHVVVNTTVTIAGSTQSFQLGSQAALLMNVFDLEPYGYIGGQARAGVSGGSLAGFITSGYPYASNLAAGQNLSAANFGITTGSGGADLAFEFGFYSSQFLDTGGFLGFRFDNGGGTQYGWARLELLTGTPENEYTVIDYAYGDVGESIKVGQTQVPVPGTIWLLATGAAGLIGWRKARKMAAKAA